MGSKGQREIWERVEQARSEQRLVDLNDEARRAGLPCRCEIGVPLWNSLFWEYPSAGKQDVLDIGELLHILHDRLKSNVLPGQTNFYIRPPRPTWWMQKRYFLNLTVRYRGDQVESVLIMPQFDTLGSLFPLVPQALPASMLARLMQTVRRFLPFCYRTELTLIRSLNATLYELLRTNPLFDQVDRYLDRLRPSLGPKEFSRDEYREVTLRSLLTQLELMAAVADKLDLEIRLPVSGLLQLMASYVGFVPVRKNGALLADKRPFH